MKLKKATNIKIDYPSKETITPILIGIGMALTISACTQPVAQEPIISQKNNKDIEESANVAGGMPVHMPPPKEQIDIHQVEKEIIVTPK